MAHASRAALSSSYLSSAHLPKVAQSFLNLLCAQTSLTFSIVVLDDNEVVPIARSYLPQQDNLRVSPYGMHLGNRLPAHATSTGKYCWQRYLKKRSTLG